MDSSRAIHASGFPILLFLCALMGCATVEGDRDPWLGRDKAKHMGVGVLIGAGAAYGAKELDASDGEARAASVAVMIPLGAGKELYDQRVKKTFWSGKDFLWGVLGGLLGGAAAVSW